jgi:hypothetical protein
VVGNAVNEIIVCSFLALFIIMSWRRPSASRPGCERRHGEQAVSACPTPFPMRRALVDAAREVAIRDGYDDAGLREIAAKAGTDGRMLLSRCSPR